MCKGMCVSLCGVKEVSILLSFAEAARNILVIFFCSLILLSFSGEDLTGTFLITSFLLSRSLQFLRLLPLHSWAHQPVQSPSELVLQSSAYTVVPFL